MKRVLLLSVLGLVALPLALNAQSLAEIAKKEDARRKAVKSPAKVYTNDDLRSDPAKTPQQAPSAPPASAQPAPGTKVPEVNLPGGKPEPSEPAKDQAYWSGRMSAARGALERSRIFAEALQSRLNALATDFVNRDDPAQRAQLEIERQRATAELERVKREIADQTKAISDIEEEARRAGVPPGWLR